MKKSIKWHRECLTNLKNSLQREEAELERVIARVERIRAHVRFYEQQIQAAVDKGKDSFDRDKFGRKVAHTG